MSHYVYILKSETKDTFYIGETSNVEQRLIWHNNSVFDGAHTKIANDWEIYFVMTCNHIQQARKIEKHIKSMKSKTYLLNLKKYPEISEKLLIRFS